MFKRSYLVLAVVLVLILAANLCHLPSILAAPLTKEEFNHFESGDMVRVVDRTVRGDVIATARNIVIKNSVIEGNLFLTGENVTIEDTTISGSVFVIARLVQIEQSSSEQSIYATVQKAYLNSVDISKNAFIAAQQVKGRVKVGGMLRAFVNTASVSGEVGDSVYIRAQSVDDLTRTGLTAPIVDIQTGGQSVSLREGRVQRLKILDLIADIVTTIVVSALVWTLLMRMRVDTKQFSKISWIHFVKGFLMILGLTGGVFTALIIFGVLAGAVAFKLYLLALVFIGTFLAMVNYAIYGGVSYFLYKKVVRRIVGGSFKVGWLVSLTLAVVLLKVVFGVPKLGFFVWLLMFSYMLSLLWDDFKRFSGVK